MSLRVKVAGSFVATAAIVAAIMAGGGPNGGGDPTPTPTPTVAACDLTATTSTFSAQLAAASNGQTICLQSGTYAEFTGTSKAVTIAAAEGASVTMAFDVGSGDGGFELVGLTIPEGDVAGTASDVTVRASEFTGNFTLQGPGPAGIVLDGNSHTYDPTGDAGNAKINVESPDGTVAAPALTIKNSEIANGDYDGIHFGGNDSSGVIVQDNYLHDLCDVGVNHTDNIQWDDIDPGMTETLISGNLIVGDCGTQGIASYDAGTGCVTIEDNVVDLHTRGSGIELYGDNNGGCGGSTVRHNTVVYHPTPCLADGGNGCGAIEMAIKPADEGGTNGTGTHVYDNVVTRVQFSNGTTGSTDHNMCRISTCTGTGSLASSSPTFVDPTPDVYSDYCLAEGSAGVAAASDGLDMGIRC